MFGSDAIGRLASVAFKHVTRGNRASATGSVQLLLLLLLMRLLLLFYGIYRNFIDNRF